MITRRWVPTLVGGLVSAAVTAGLVTLLRRAPGPDPALIDAQRQAAEAQGATLAVNTRLEAEQLRSAELRKSVEELKKSGMQMALTIHHLAKGQRVKGPKGDVGTDGTCTAPEIEVAPETEVVLLRDAASAWYVEGSTTVHLRDTKSNWRSDTVFSWQKPVNHSEPSPATVVKIEERVVYRAPPPRSLLGIAGGAWGDAGGAGVAVGAMWLPKKLAKDTRYGELRTAVVATLNFNPDFSLDGGQIVVGFPVGVGKKQ